MCEHGPALLFERRSDTKVQQFYACSAYRDQADCPLYVPIEQNDPKIYNRNLLAKNVDKSLKLATEKSILLQKVTTNLIDTSNIKYIFSINENNFVNNEIILGSTDGIK